MVRTSAELRRRLLAQRRRSGDWVRREFAVTVEHVADRLPEWKNHPYFVEILWEWYAPLAGDLPRDYYPRITDECGRFFKRLPWPPRDDDKSISVAKCRSALGPAAAAMNDAQVRFVRDQLYVLAETVLDGCRPSNR
jgi:hypothetical protein